MAYAWDGRGSATSELDGAGVLMSSWSYSATGAIWSGTTSDLPRYGWDAEEASGATGLVYLRARYLSVSEGVFTGRDLHLGSAANPATLNRYAYALSDPVNLYDPLGLASWLSGVASRISSAASSPFARVAEAVSQAFSAATSRFQSAVGAVQAAVGSASSVSYRPSWAVTVAGYASHVSAAVIERCCGTAAYMVKSAPKAAGYDRSKAVAYADEYSLALRDRSGFEEFILGYVFGVGRSPGFPRYRNNCANFVSQALLAGGLETTEQWRPSGMEPWLSKSGNHAAYAESASLAWMNVKAQYLYFSNPEHGYTASPVVNLYGENGTSIAGMTNVSINTIGDVYAAGVREGDLIYFYSLDQNGEPTPAHAAMVSSVKSNELLTLRTQLVVSIKLFGLQ